MKKCNYNLMIILFSIFILNTQLSFGQTQVTRDTPQESSVTAYNQITEMSSGDISDWSYHVETYYPNATELNAPSATTSYNCHAYAWHISEGGDNVWIGYYQNEQDHEDIYWTDGSYIRLNSESGADKISYYEDNHSAIQTSTQGTYISKWGQGPLMQHVRDYGPSGYELDDRYYYDQPKIKGNGLLCYQSSYTYSVQDFNNVTYTWTTSSNLQINGSSTSRTVSVSPTTSSGNSGYVRVSIYISSHNETRVITKDVWVSQPAFDVNEYIFSNGIGENGFLCTSHAGNEFDISYFDDLCFCDNYEVKLTNIYNTQTFDQFYTSNGTGELDYSNLSEGYYLFWARGHNDCGWGDWYENEIEFVDCSMMESMFYIEVFPNPTIAEATIELKRYDKEEVTENTEWEFEVFDMGQNLKLKSNKIRGKKHKISPQDWKRGIYIVRAKINDELITTKLIVDK